MQMLYKIVSSHFKFFSAFNRDFETLEYDGKVITKEQLTPELIQQIEEEEDDDFYRSRQQQNHIHVVQQPPPEPTPEEKMRSEARAKEFYSKEWGDYGSRKHSHPTHVRTMSVEEYRNERR